MARPGSSAAVASSAASTIVGQKFPAPSGSANAADKPKMKKSAGPVGQRRYQTKNRFRRARVRAYGWRK
jgi:hypothetical protein